MSHKIAFATLLHEVKNEDLFSEITLEETATIIGGGWTQPAFLEGRGTRNCGAARAQQDAQNNCQALANVTNQKLVKAEVYNYDPSYSSDIIKGDKCVYRATYRCLLE
ncbi:hypothetical protein [Nostoc sp. CALU 1950]|uniref:hypothetical protein n=1 Tax=Nostoc sp. CALU 1950 TaxID=3104321 RepID=UPI003EBBC25F